MFSNNNKEIIGHVSENSGPIKVTDPEGNIKTLHPGDPIYMNDIAENNHEEYASIMLINGQLMHIMPTKPTFMKPELVTYSKESSDNEVKHENENEKNINNNDKYQDINDNYSVTTKYKNNVKTNEINLEQSSLLNKQLINEQKDYFEDTYVKYINTAKKDTYTEQQIKSTDSSYDSSKDDALAYLRKHMADLTAEANDAANAANQAAAAIYANPTSENLAEAEDAQQAAIDAANTAINAANALKTTISELIDLTGIDNKSILLFDAQIAVTNANNSSSLAITAAVDSESKADAVVASDNAKALQAAIDTSATQITANTESATTTQAQNTADAKESATDDLITATQAAKDAINADNNDTAYATLTAAEAAGQTAVNSATSYVADATTLVNNATTSQAAATLNLAAADQSVLDAQEALASANAANEDNSVETLALSNALEAQVVATTSLTNADAALSAADDELTDANATLDAANVLDATIETLADDAVADDNAEAVQAAADAAITQVTANTEASTTTQVQNTADAKELATDNLITTAQTAKDAINTDNNTAYTTLTAAEAAGQTAVDSANEYVADATILVNNATISQSAATLNLAASDQSVLDAQEALASANAANEDSSVETQALSNAIAAQVIATTSLTNADTALDNANDELTDANTTLDAANVLDAVIETQTDEAVTDQNATTVLAAAEAATQLGEALTAKTASDNAQSTSDRDETNVIEAIATANATAQTDDSSTAQTAEGFIATAVSIADDYVASATTNVNLTDDYLDESNEALTAAQAQEVSARNALSKAQASNEDTTDELASITTAETAVSNAETEVVAATQNQQTANAELVTAGNLQTQANQIGDSKDNSVDAVEDTTLVIDASDLLSNDTNAVTITGVTASDDTHGIVTINADGNIEFAPAENYNGTAIFTYTTVDANGVSDTATTTVNVKGVADAAQTNLAEAVVNDGSINARAESFEDFENVTGTTNAFLTGVLGSAGGEDVYRFTHSGGPLTLNALTERSASAGSAYTDLDGSGTQAMLDIMLKLTDVNGVQIAQNDDGGTTGGAISDGSVHSFDSYIHQTNLPAGEYFVKVTSFQAATTGPYRITMTGEFELDYNPYVTEQGETLVIDDTLLLSNDDVATTFSMTSVQDAQHGTVSINADGNIEFIPNNGYAGIASFTYIITDANGNEDIARVTLNVTGTNTSGEEAVLQADMPQGTSILDMTEDTLATLSDVLGTVTFPDGDGSETHTIRIELDATSFNAAPTYVEYGEDHSFTLANGKYFAEVNGDNLDTTQIQMPENFNGYVSANITLIAVESDVDLLANGDVDTSSAGYYEHTHLVNFNVEAVNDAATISGTIDATVDEDNTITLTQADLLANATDVDGDDLTASNVQLTGSGATIADNGDGTFTIIPIKNYSGLVNATFNIFDGTETVQSSVNLSVTPVADIIIASLAESVSSDFEEGTGWIDPQDFGWNTDNPDGLVERSNETTYGGSDASNLVVEMEGFSGDPSNMYRILDTQPGATYNFSLDISGRSAVNAADSQVEILWEGVIIDTVGYENFGWHTHSYDLIATQNKSRIEFRAADQSGSGSLIDNINLTFSGFRGDEDSAIPIVLSSEFTDMDGSETISSSILGLPVGSVITDGVNVKLVEDATQSIEMAVWDTDNLTVTPPQNFFGTINITMSVVATETANGDTLTTEIPIILNVTSVNDAPTITLIDSTLEGNHSLTFDGVSEKIEFDEGLIDPNNFTMSLTVNPANINNGDWQGFIGCQGDTYRSPSMWVNPDNGGLHFDAYDSVTFERFNFELDNVFENGVAVNITVVKDGNEFRMYLNGDTEPALVRSAPDQVHLEDNFNIGGVDNYFEGTLDNVQIYDTALSPQDIRSINNDEITQPNDLVFHLDFEGNTPFENKAGTDILFTITGIPDIVIEGQKSVIAIDEDDPAIVAMAADIDGTINLTDSNASNGALALDDDGNITYTPNENYAGTDIVTLVVTDDDGADSTKIFNLRINAVDDAIVFNDDTNSITELSNSNATNNISGNVVTNDFDIDDDISINITNHGTIQGDYGTLTIASDGLYSYELDDANTTVDALALNEILTERFDIDTIENLSGQTDTTDLVITINGTNDAPVLNVESAKTIDEDGTVKITFVANDIDGTLTTVASAEHGAVIVNNDSTITYSPDENFFGSDTISMTTTDNDGEAVTQTSAITVNDVNDAPTITVSETSSVQNHSLSLDGDGDKIVFDDPTLDPNNFTISLWVNPGTINDGAFHGFLGHQGVLGTDRSPSLWVGPKDGVLHYDSFSADGSTRHGGIIENVFLSSDTPVHITWVKDGDQFRFHINGDENPIFTLDNIPESLLLFDSYNVGGVDNNFIGILDDIQIYDTGLSAEDIGKIYDGEITQPDNLTFHLDFEGDEPFSNKADNHISFTIEGNPQIINEGTREIVAVVEDTAIIVASAVDIDGTVDLTQSSATHGSLSMDDDGNITYTPTPDYSGLDTVTLLVTDDDGATSTTTFNVSVSYEDDVPLLNVESSKTIDEDGTAIITFTVSDVDGTIVSTTATADHGTVTINNNGTMSYVPDANYHGTDNVTVISTDNDGLTTTQESAITINDINDAPTVVTDTATITETTIISINAIANDFDVDAGSSISYESVQSEVMLNGVQVGTAILSDADVSFEIYASDLTGVESNVHGAVKNDTNYVGGDLTIDGTVYDKGILMHAATGGLSTLTFNIPDDATNFTAVLGIDDASSSGSVVYSIAVDDVVVYTSATITGANAAVNVDIDVSGSSEIKMRVDDLGSVNGDHAGWGEAKFAGTYTEKQIAFTPNDNLGVLSDGEQAQLDITYTVVDELGLSQDGTVALNVTGSNTGPTITTIDDTVFQGVAQSIALAADIDGTVTLTNGSAAKGSVTMNANGEIIYTADDNYVGSDLVNIEVVDNNGVSFSQIISVDVDGNNLPTITTVDTTITEDVAQIIATASDIEGSVSLDTSSADHGTLSMDANGNITYTPDANYNGADTVNLTVIDEQGSTATQAINLTINSVNDNPVAVDDAALAIKANSQSPLIIDSSTLLNNDSDVDGDTLSVISITATDVTHGTVELVEDKSIEFDGSSSYMEVASLAVDLVGASTITFDTTFSTSAISSTAFDNNLFAITGENGSSNLVRVGITGNGAIFVNDLGNVHIGGGYNDGQDHTLSVTFTHGGQPTIIVDGVTLDASGLLDQNINITAGCRTTIGGDWDNNDMSDYFDGNISNAKISIGEEVIANYEMRGDDITQDTSGNGHNATFNGTLTTEVIATEIEFMPDANYAGNSSFDYTISDGNGGTSSAIANINIVNGNIYTTSQEGSSLLGGADDDIFFVGHNGTFTGGGGADTFDLNHLGTASDPAETTIADLNMGDGDVLDISDLLIDEENNDLMDYLNFDHTDTTNHILEIRDTPNGEVKHKVNLQGVDFSSYGVSDAEIINGLLSDGNLRVDE